MARNYAQQLVETLEKQGVEHIYGLVGDSLNPIVDAVRRSSIEWIHVRNEEAAAFAAEADSLTTGKLAVCAASCGPGNTHLIQGLYDANRNGAKVLALASHIPSRQIGSAFFQETHPEQIFQECSGYCEMVLSGDQGGVVLHHAIQSTMAGNGVSVLVIPGDVSTEEVDDDTFVESKISTGNPVVYPDPAEAAALTQAINEAESVAFFVGAGVKDAREQVLKLAEKVKAPIGHALGGKMYIQYDNPFDVGMSGLLGYGAAHEATHEADLLILLGTDFPYNDFLPKGNVAQVDINGSHIGRRTKISYPVTGDVAATIDNILPHVEEKKDRSFLDKMLKKHYDKLENVVEAYTSNVENHTPIHPEYIASLIDQEADDDAIFTVDTGMCNVWGARYITPNGKREQIGSFRHGTMANALPQAIGAQKANPGRQVITFSGDGGLSMLMGELLTVKLHQLPVKMFVFNNSSLGMVKLEMLVGGIPEHETDHESVDFSKIAEAAGIKTFRIEDPKQAPQQIKKALAYNGPALIDVVTDPNALSLPPTLTFDQLLGFSKAATRTVFGGGVGSMLSMAKSNLRNIPRPQDF
ncbi:pyruvate dehydrogenase [Corynebacterium macginleyi]|uniref:Pyruvate dehydrogenase n=1 Tax=Corynebacterium macginleyi TaxID=38290 RepID=A0ABS1Y827_9CORY|nr:pyruvate dehydrogenase [Corynebacterium macginleyi]MBK4139586.1 pyruvate dehydrogenase [Corynebacterium macginleyi]MBK4144311.1 pyruvate dehydrogenase [Corynebacterium macginleyi]MBK4149820.1 pyruvate dehydrogenase [Corynebacterium macginleyi]MBK4152379.1 pyruvate dehydrogenase [Corynebacterium macginleyi]MBK4157481.1 pyruvate dehydrogenase [Corynebacterium macginleyi]